MTLSFKEKVYSAVKKIPKGKGMTYKQVAVLARKPRAYRAVGFDPNDFCLGCFTGRYPVSPPEE